MAMPDESTPLLRSETLADESPPKPYFEQDKKIQLCSLIAVALILALIGASIVWIFLGESPSPENPSFLNSNTSKNESLEFLLNNSWPRPDLRIQALPFTNLNSGIVDEAINDGKRTLATRASIENDIDPIASDSPSYRHQSSIVHSPRGYDLSKFGYIENEATKYLRNKGYNSVILYDSATELKWTSESECDKLSKKLPCRATEYRTISGECNNLHNPRKWGVAMTPFRRALPANYSDEVSDPRGGFVTELPSARDVSTMVHRPVHRQDNNFTVMLAVWGQFIDHDITATALSRGVNGSTISCCGAKNQHPECFPVFLNKTDEYYSKYNITCMEFVRSATALRCSFGPREQLNQASSYLDGSMIYGNTEELSNQLRTFRRGLLEVTYTSDGRALLPVSKDPTDGCNQAEEIKKGRYCFLSGDSRANENTHLTSIHLIFVRHHNSIADQLAGLNPHWNDETLYQEARRIVVAQVQHITYNEFLPIIIGPDMMNELELYSLGEGYWNKYNSSVDATIANNFAASSFRFAHTLIPRLMKLVANDNSSTEYVEMHKMLFNPFGLYKGDLDAIIRGALSTNIEKADNYFNTQLTEHLFESNSKLNTTHSFGLDLVALNIQRGRDHGLPTYPYWREYCGFPRPTSFKDLEDSFDKESLKIISTIYKNVDEIDLYTGALSEYPIRKGLLGPTFTCLIADQFYRLKHGDRFWYETNEKPQAFTEEQLNEIRKTSLAGILCKNSDDLENVTPLVMKSTSEKNSRTSCHNIPQPDLTTFKVDRSNEPSQNELNSEKIDHQPTFGPNFLINKRAKHLYNSSDERSHYDYFQIHKADLESLRSKIPIGSEPEKNITHEFEKLPDSNEVAKIHDTKEAYEYFPEVFKIRPLIDSQTQKDIEEPKIRNITVVADSIEIEKDKLYDITPPVAVSEDHYNDTIFKWRWSPETKSIRGSFNHENENGSFRLNYKKIEGSSLSPDCVYYSKVGSYPDFELSYAAESGVCSRIAPVTFNNTSWDGNVTISVHDLANNLGKEEELSLNSKDIRYTLKSIKGSISIILEGGDVTVWNGTIPAVFEPKLIWLQNKGTVAYPVSWSGIGVDGSFTGTFLLPEKQDDIIVWHEGKFSLDLGNNSGIIKPFQVYTSILYLTSNDGIELDITDLEENTDWNLNQYSRIIIKSDFSEGKFLWNGDITFIIPKIEEDDKKVSYRPYTRYTGEILAGELYAELSGSKYLWWSGALPSTIFIPVNMPRGYKHIFDQVLLWTFTPSNSTLAHATFITYGNDSRILLSGDFEFKIASILNSPGLSPKTTYYSPIVLQQNINEFSDDIADILSHNKDTPGKLAPVTLLGKYLRKERLFAWNGKFIISIVDND